jgi:hypothetical protein
MGGTEVWFALKTLASLTTTFLVSFAVALDIATSIVLTRMMK